MTSALLMYFSITGTTRRVAERVADGLRRSGVETTIHDLREGPAPDAGSFDIVGVGSPVHYFRLPVQVSDGLAALGPLEGKSGFAFTLQGSYRGAALNIARRALARHGATEVGSLPMSGEGHFLGYLRQGYLFFPGHPDAPELDGAEVFGAEVADAHRARVSEGARSSPRPPDPDVGWVYRLERLATRPVVARAVLSRFFSADPDSCTRCGRCAHACPTGNIAWSKGTRPVWGRDCTLCATCAAICPADAVRTPLDWWVFTPFMRYNVRRASADPGIEYVRVVHARGRDEVVSGDVGTGGGAA